MSDIEAIETSYKNYRFRSRLEARWAIFFDALKLDWAYEPEGFKIEGGKGYLPDFYFPKHDVYIEIKPLTVNHRELKKPVSLAFGNGKAIAIVAGNTPRAGAYQIAFCAGDEKCFYAFDEFFQCHGCSGVWMHNARSGLSKPLLCKCDLRLGQQLENSATRTVEIETAELMATSARFN